MVGCFATLNSHNKSKIMGKLMNLTQVLILVLCLLVSFHISLACPTCPHPTPSNHTPKVKPPHKFPTKPKPPVVVVKPPHHLPKPSPSPCPPKPSPHVPKPPTVKPPHLPEPPAVEPPHLPKPQPPTPVVHPPNIPKPPIVYPPIIPTPPTTPIPLPPTPPAVPIPSPEAPFLPPPKSPETPCPPPPLPPKGQETCPTLNLDACVDVLGGLIHIGIGNHAKDTCCPVLAGLVDLDAALCLCTTIKAKLLNINIIIPIALQVLLDCGKTTPSGFQCHA